MSADLFCICSRHLRLVCLLLVTLGLRASAQPADASISPPPLGWASWNSFANAYDATVIEQQAQAMVHTGMKAAGYQYLLLDEGWWLGRRDDDGNIVVDKQQWPALAPGEQAGDMANIVRYLHRTGLKAAIYTDAGEFGCSYTGPDIGPPWPHTGSYGHYEQDFLQFARWGFDYVKVDWCGGDKPNLDAATQYAEIARALTDAERVTGHRMFYSICDWGRGRPWTWAPGIGGVTANMWRTGGDIIPPIVDDPMHADRSVKTAAILRNFDEGVHPEAQHTGFYNDPDMMVVGMRGTTNAMDRLHMSLWAISGAPLMVGADLSKLTPEQAGVLTNAEVLAVDQDALGLQGAKVAEPGPGLEVWSKPLSGSGERAVVLLNRTEAAASIAVSPRELGLATGEPVKVRDLWQHTEDAASSGTIGRTVGAGEAEMLLVRGREPELRNYAPEHETAAGSCAFCSAETDRREYVRFTHVVAAEPMVLVRIGYTGVKEHSEAVMMQVNQETPTLVQIKPASEGTVTVQAPFDTAKENTVAFWLPGGGRPPITTIALHTR